MQRIRTSAGEHAAFRTVLGFTLAYGVIGLCLIAGQPRDAAGQSADAAASFDAPAAQLGPFSFRIASAE